MTLSDLYKEKIRKDFLPRHIAIIMDGNGRWAKKKGNNRIFGHRNAIKAVREVSEAASELGIHYLTLYAFSTENWKRPRTEIDALMSLLLTTIHSEIKTLQQNNIRLFAIGNMESLPPKVNRELENAIQETSQNTGLTLTLALSYGSRWEILNAVKKIGKQILEKNICPEDITPELFSQYLTTASIPDPELLIRTSGEYRISNFLLWQIAYTEFYFTPKLWPDFCKNDFYEAIVDYQSRERRFGKITEQIMK